MTAPTLACIGNVTIDEAVQPDGTRSLAPGGDALFAALAARTRLDHVTWLAPVGADLPDDLLRDLDAAGLNAAAPHRRVEPTVLNRVTYQPDGSRTWELVHGEAHFEAMSVHPDDVPAAVLAQDGILISAMARTAQTEVTGWLRNHTTATVFLDLQEDYLRGYEADWLSVIADCDVFLPSEVEALALSAGPDLEQAIRMFAGLGPRTVVVKRAGKSCLLLESGSDAVVEVPVTAVDPVDSTGAGDAFCGAFAAEYLLSGNAVRAVEAGSQAARLAISAPGILGLLPTARSVRSEAGPR